MTGRLESAAAAAAAAAAGRSGDGERGTAQRWDSDWHRKCCCGPMTHLRPPSPPTPTHPPTRRPISRNAHPPTAQHALGTPTRGALAGRSAPSRDALACRCRRLFAPPRGREQGVRRAARSRSGAPSRGKGSALARRPPKRRGRVGGGGAARMRAPALRRRVSIAPRQGTSLDARQGVAIASQDRVAEPRRIPAVRHRNSVSLRGPSPPPAAAPSQLISFSPSTSRARAAGPPQRRPSHGSDT